MPTLCAWIWIGGIGGGPRKTGFFAASTLMLMPYIILISSMPGFLLMALISYRNLSVSFGGPMLLDDAGITIDKKERICLLGRNGEGKSTLLRVLAGQVTPDKGEYERMPDLRIAK